VTVPVEEKLVIIGERNQVATEKIMEAINRGYKRIAVLYGGGHMPDLGRCLREELNMVPADVQPGVGQQIPSILEDNG
jgi:pheromone shutdown protein TraB